METMRQAIAAGCFAEFEAFHATCAKGRVRPARRPCLFKQGAIKLAGIIRSAWAL